MSRNINIFKKDKPIIIEKGWGHEEIFASNDEYCGKLLVFKANSQFSLHFHMVKRETWRVLSGEFLLKLIRPSDADIITIAMNTGDIFTVEPGVSHQLSTETGGTILEVSTADYVDDSYRVEKGDSQK